MMKVLVLDLWGDYAHFRKYFTTSSPLTFAFPPKTALYGIVSAIIGLDKNEYLKYFQDKKCKIAIRILNPIKKTRISINYIDTKIAVDMGGIRGRTQVNLEVLKDVKYRIYFYHEDNELQEKLKTFLKEHKNVYTISLGLSEFIANFSYIGEYRAKEINEGKMAEIHSIIPFNEDIKIKFDSDREYLKDTVYNEMNENREVTEYIRVLFERKGNSITSTIPHHLLESGERIVFI